ncbi:MAG: SufS family cysteine desulfurase [Patescibacteria group bacterium]
MFSIEQLKRDFPILSKKIHEKRLVYLDNAATSQKPKQVIEAIVNYYENHNANVHRGVHQLAEESTQVFEDSRKVISRFFGADDEELILVRNTTEAINGVAYGWALDHLKKGDVVVTTEMEHHSNIVPWQEICKRTGATLQFVKVDENGRLDWKSFNFSLLVKLVVLTHVSNTLGTLNPIEKMIKKMKSQNKDIKILVDGAQSAPHLKIDFHQLDIDFFIFSGHKMLGPMGIGGLLVKKELVTTNELKPWLFGGGMIESVYEDHTNFNESPQDRFTAGTPDVASTVGLAAACNYLSKLDMHEVELHDRELVAYAIKRLSEFSQIKIVGPTTSSTDTLDRIGSVAFLYEGVHPHDIAQVLDSQGVEVRSGHHCTMPLHTKFNWPGTTRVSFQVYNTLEDVDVLVESLKKVTDVFGK